MQVTLNYENLSTKDLQTIITSIFFSLNFISLTFNKLKKYLIKNFNDIENDSRLNQANYLQRNKLRGDVCKFNEFILKLDKCFCERVGGYLDDGKDFKIVLGFGRSKFKVFMKGFYSAVQTIHISYIYITTLQLIKIVLLINDQSLSRKTSNTQRSCLKSSALYKENL